MRIPRLLKTTGVLLVLFAGAYWLLNRAEPESTVQSALLVEEAQSEQVTDEFGIVLNALNSSDHVVKRHETFSAIFAQHNVPREDIALLVERTKPVFDIRNLRVGNSYRVYRADSSATHIVYQKDPIQYIVFDLESLRVRQGKLPVETVRRTVGGRITSSLYNALEEQGIQAALAVKLSEIFAWQIDFFALQKGDNFKVIYEEELVNGTPVGIKDIVAARFNHAGEDFYAFQFEQDGERDFFDENGNGLRKALLMSPLEFGRLTSGFSLRRFHPVQKRVKAHLGTDYAAPTGTPIHAVGDGVVLEASRTRGNGNYVKIRHNSTYTTAYLHMSRIARGIKPGTRVRQKQVIGYVGSTGLATGPHVCYRLWKNGVQVDSRKEKLPPSEPVQAVYRAEFEKIRNNLIPLLQDSGFIPYLAAQGLSTDYSLF